MILKEFGSSPLQRGRTRTTGKVYIGVTALNYLLCVSKGKVCMAVYPFQCILNSNLILNFGSKQGVELQFDFECKEAQLH